MSRPRIALIPGTLLVDGKGRAKLLEDAGAEVVVAAPPGSEEFQASLAGVDGVIGAGPFNAGALRRLGDLRIIVGPGVGVDFVDLDAATELGIVVANLPDICIDEVADHATFLLLACYRRYPQTMALVREGLWARADTEPRLGSIPRLRGQTLGLVAFGNIAHAFAERASALGLYVIAYDPFVPDSVFLKHAVERADLPELCRRSDFISIHTPLNPRYAKMISVREFDAMKPTAFIINTARGGVIDEPALIDALRSGRIAGAGLDVFDPEPPDPGNPLLGMDNVIHTPHTGGLSDGSSEAAARQGVEEMLRALRGEWPTSVQNPAVMSKFEPSGIFGDREG